MSIDFLPSHGARQQTPAAAAGELLAPPPVTAPAPAEGTREAAAPALPRSVSPALWVAHEVDRAEARIDRLRDELERLRQDAAGDQNVDVAETRLISALHQAERAREARGSQ